MLSVLISTYCWREGVKLAKSLSQDYTDDPPYHSYENMSYLDSYIIWYRLILLSYGNLNQRPFGARFPIHKHPKHLEMRSVEVAVICNDYMVPIVTFEMKTLPNSFSRILAGNRCPPTSAKSSCPFTSIARWLAEVYLVCTYNNTWFHTYIHQMVMVASAWYDPM